MELTNHAQSQLYSEAWKLRAIVRLASPQHIFLSAIAREKARKKAPALCLHFCVATEASQEVAEQQQNVGNKST